jgi:hypothetical protein
LTSLGSRGWVWGVAIGVASNLLLPIGSTTHGVIKLTTPANLLLLGVVVECLGRGSEVDIPPSTNGVGITLPLVFDIPVLLALSDGRSVELIPLN